MYDRIFHNSLGNGKGVLYSLSSKVELETFVRTELGFSVILVLESLLFTLENLKLLFEKRIVTGILLMPPENRTNLQDSPETTYPNKAYGLYPSSTYEWNPLGSGLLYVKADIPIFRLNPSHVELIKKSVRDNRERNYRFPLNGLEMSSFMWGAHDSQTCLRRKFCIPLGGQSVYSNLASLGQREFKKTVLFTSTLDTSSFFHDIALGADAFTAGIVTALAIAETLTRLDMSSFKKNVAFAFFNAESWGYGGSKKFVHDLNLFSCLQIDPDDPFMCINPRRSTPILNSLSMTSLDHVIDLNQIAGLNYNSSNGTLFLHLDNRPNEQSSQLANLFLQVSQNFSRPNFIRRAFIDPYNGPGLPPGSLMSFLAVNRTIPAVMITDFQTSFVNPYFFSMYDDATSIDLNKTADILCEFSKVATMVAYLLVTESDLDSLSPHYIQPNCTLVS